MKVLFFIIFAFSSLAHSQNKKSTPTIEDLGFEKDNTREQEELQKQLQERRVYLREHQFWGLLSLGGLGATILTGEADKIPNAHFALGMATAATYGFSAYFALKAPVPNSFVSRGMSLWHRRLAWVHGVGMILTPILGYLYAEKLEKSQPPNGLTKNHTEIAGVTAAALLASVISVSFEF